MICFATLKTKLGSGEEKAAVHFDHEANFRLAVRTCIDNDTDSLCHQKDFLCRQKWVAGLTMLLFTHGNKKVMTGPKDIKTLQICSFFGFHIL